MVVTQKQRTKIIPIASGKGGVGKTELCANLGIRLGQLGKRTVLMDLDMGGSNLHSALNLKNRNPGVGNYLSDRRLSFDSLIVETGYENVRFIPGDVLVAGTPNLTYAQKSGLIKQIEKIDADYVLLDLGSGASNNVVDFFLISNSGLIVSSPHVGAILNAYSFLKNATFRFLMRAFSGESSASRFLRKQVRERRPGESVQVKGILKGLAEKNGEQAKKAKQYVSLLQPSLVLNMARSSGDLNIAESLRELSRKNLNVDLQCLGAVLYDRGVSERLHTAAPAIMSDPQGLLAAEVDRLAQKIVQSPSFPTLALETDLYEDSFELTRIEIQYDEAEQSEKASSPEDEAFNPEEFLAIVTAQKKRIQELQGTVRMLTMRSNGG
ncbi:MAG: AAA family ATPase [Alkalispirochaetaceae bacterium]